MAKKQAKVKEEKAKEVKGANKSQAIRECKAANPEATPKEIAAALAKAGHPVTAQFVSTVLSNAKKKGGKIGKRGPKVKANAKKFADSLGGNLEPLIQAKKFADAVGGVENARSAINVLAQLGL